MYTYKRFKVKNVALLEKEYNNEMTEVIKIVFIVLYHAMEQLVHCIMTVNDYEHL